MTDAGSARGVEAQRAAAAGRLRARAARLARALDLLGRRLERLDGLHDEARLVGVLVVDAAAHEDDRVDAQRALVLGERLAEDEDLDRALEVVERREHHRVALARADLLGRGDDPAGGDPVAVLALASSASGQSTSARSASRTSLSGCAEMNRPIDSFSTRQQLGLVELLGRDRRVARRGERRAARRRRRRRRASPRSKIEPWPISRVLLGLLARRPAPARARASMPLRVAPVEPNAPHLMSASIAFLLTARGVDARAEVPQRRRTGRPPRARP